MVKMYENIIKDFKERLKDNLVAAIKFGTEGEPNNLLLVFDELDFDMLEQIKPLIIRHKRETNLVPVLFTERGLKDGADVFPLEFLDMKYPHTVLYGKNVINNIKFEKKHVRRQLEFELRSKLIHLRENYIWIKKDKELRALLLSAVPSLMPLFYGLLFLKNVKKMPTKLNALFELIKEKYKIDVGVLKEIKELKDRKVSSDELVGYVKELMKFLDELITIVDKMKV